VAEAHAVFRALAAGASLADVRSECLGGRLLRQSAAETRRHIWQALHWRYFDWKPPAWVLSDLAEAARGDATDPRFVGLLYLHYARRDLLTFGFVVDKLWNLWLQQVPEVRREDVMDFLDERGEEDPRIRTWRESTRRKLAGNVLSALRDFGLLKGVQRKMVQRPMIPPEVALHLCRLLHAEGRRGRSLTEAKDWRLFLWDTHDTVLALATLSKRGDIRFEKAGRTVVLEVPPHSAGHGEA